MTDARTLTRWDHDRDERKHEWRPGDPLTHADARTIAMLARAPSTSLDDAVEMIKLYAEREAHEAAAKAVHDSHRSVTDTLGVLFEPPAKIGASA
jgi:hypothetical protein